MPYSHGNGESHEEKRRKNWLHVNNWSNAVFHGKIQKRLHSVYKLRAKLHNLQKAKAAFKLLLDRFPIFEDMYTCSLNSYNKSNENEYSIFRNISIKRILKSKDEYTSSIKI